MLTPNNTREADGPQRKPAARRGDLDFEQRRRGLPLAVGFGFLERVENE